MNAAKKRYWNKRPPTFPLSQEERAWLAENNSYPVLGGNICLGTGDPPCNVKVVVKDGVERIKGAVFLEDFRKKNRRKNVNY